MSIYSNFKPTFLYIKQHNDTKLKYFGKTVLSYKKMLSYTGSGKYWLAHLKKHGKNISTIWFKRFNNPNDLFYFATIFSEANDITNSIYWANLIEENGFQGGSSTFTQHAIEKGIEKRTLLYGNGFGQCHTEEIITKAQNTYKLKYGHLMSCCHTNNARQKRQKTMLEKYGENFDPRNTIEARNKAKQTVKNKYLDKENVRNLMNLSQQYNIKLGTNWYYKDDSWINNKIQEILHNIS